VGLSQEGDTPVELEKQLKYIDFTDIYSALDDNEQRN